MPDYRLSDFVARFGGELLGTDVAIRQVAALETAKSDEIGFLANPKYAKQLGNTTAGAVVLSTKSRASTDKPRIVVADPYLYFARISTLLNPPARPASGVHPSAVLAAGVMVDATAHIGPFVSVGEGSHIGANCILEAGCRVGSDVVLGDGTWLHANVVVADRSQLGQRVIVHPGAVIGSDGFGNAWTGEGWFKIPQIGRVLIGDDVEIGAATSIDRGALGDTIIEDGVRLDNQIQIAHNVHIGKHTAMAGCVGVAGSTRIGAYCTFGGSAMILGHLEIADRVNIMAGTLVGKSILKAGTYVGQYPVQSHEDWLANASHLRRLDAMAGRLKQIERRVGRDDAEQGE
ncbi:UDP-3-O-(3-hydroxymyristoyl)glucosamine N-acyltransferase [Chitinimonas sp. BJB300]|uniref:UDP-3-O-(3-hydroxymyristoyl)glucosamine N-acyltransferase n=1 Tax=Chitinimonas sp. BJB300 TaxID=1559339 RepID=UPI000C0EBDCE|nr:UDP-3-O-(3-hydroxymyristoyl)glucosamine N-acyltransferase [Chitinimonas sp. BJB300]PHV13121.1 UDP-3-O-(3-hydroxymyristoyl)glucosamine N-acyltransferase [Chitinimonas sp. BJB300]TSJ84718.1 UDP-3-O-(3-hydroxymyristoyl)glucosamine N-acyltransferase [Chitinimonas sp. BJB300]